MAGEPVSALRRILPYTSIALLIAALYVAWVFFSRWQANRDVEQARREKQAESSRQVLEALGGTALKIESFSATPGATTPGGRVLLCYGVNNATTVTIDPFVDGAGPSLSRCLEVHPKKTTVYTITAGDKAGHKVSEKLTVAVQ